MTIEGRVKRVLSKGYGFIETDKGIDYFFHRTAYDGDFKTLLLHHSRGEIVIVEFEDDPTSDKAPRAVNVKVKTALGS